MKVGEKAKELIGDFSTATEQTALNPTVAAFNLYCATREDLEDYIAELETFIDQLIEAGNELTANPAFGNYEEREAAWTKLWLKWRTK